MSRAVLTALVLLAVAGCTDREFQRTFALDASQSHACGEGYIVFVRNGSIHRMRADGTDLLPLTSGDDDRSPRWSPDGSRIAFLRSGDLWIMDADGGNAEIARSEIRGTPVGLAWSPGGGHIAIALTDNDRPVALYDMASDTIAFAGYVGLGGKPELFIAWSPDGEWLLYAFHNDTGGARRALLKTVRPDRTDEQLLVEVAGSVSGVAWSPDGLYIAVARNPSAGELPSLKGEAGIEIFDVEGASHGTVPFVNGPASDPFWSPDSGCLGVTSYSLLIGDLFSGGTSVLDGEMGDWTRSIDEERPVARFTATPDSVAVGEDVFFDPSTSTDDGEIVKYIWDFGNGVHRDHAVAQVTQLAYDAAGSYMVRLTVRDAAGKEDTATRTMTVTGTAMVTLTIEFVGGAAGSVTVFVNEVEVQTCSATCSIPTPVGAQVRLVPSGGLDAWTGCNQDLGALECTLTMDADRTVQALIKPPS